jgi:branched-chain amino acid transport system permease protein
MNQFLQLVTAGLALGGVYGMVSLGFSIVYNATRVLNFAHGEFVMMGGLITAVLSSTYHVSPPLAALAATAVVCLLGVGLDRFAIQTARRKEHLTLVMITIGAGTAFRGLMEVIVGRDIYFMPPFPGIPDMSVGGIFIAGQAIWVAALLALVSTALWALFQHTSVGKAMRAASGNMRAAQLYGISPQKMSMLSYAIAGSIGALAGAVVTPMAAGYYQAGLFYGVKGFAATILGGLGNPLGAVVGGLTIGVLESMASGYISSGYKDSIALGILLIMLLIRPSGLFGQVEAVRV